MKSCPKCDQTFSDDTLNFCLTDGSLLKALDEVPTVVMHRSASSPLGGTLKWILLAFVVLLAGLGVATAAFFYMYSGKADSEANNNQIPANRPVKTEATPSVLPSSTPDTSTSDQSSQDANTSSSPAIEENSDEATPINWDTTAGGFKGAAGKTFKFLCPPDGTSRGIYGHDVYTDYSSICTASVHAGLIDIEKGGEVTLEYRPGRQIYGSTERNGIKSNTAGENLRSFVVR